MFLIQIKNICVVWQANLLLQSLFASFAGEKSLFVTEISFPEFLSSNCYEVVMTWYHASIPKFDDFKMASDQEVLDTIDISTIEETTASEPLAKKVKKKVKTNSGSPRRQWSDDQVKLLIETYQTYPCLWDINRKEYMNRDKKDLAYEQVDEVMRPHGITRDEYKQKWGILRGQLMRELEKERKSSKSGIGTDSKYSSTWKWYKTIMFVNTGTVESDTEDTMVLEGDEIKKTNSVKGSKRSLKEELAKKRIEVMEKAVVALSKPDTGTQETQNKVITEEDAFGSVVARTLERLTNKQKAIAKKKIMDALFEVEFANGFHV